jgi:hypothetical protein
LNEIINYPPLEVAILKILALTWCLRQWQNFATEPSPSTEQKIGIF